jgi:transcriptional regulator GlxA family with amidase domain
MSTEENKKLTVGIFIFDEVEVLDFCGPFEVFATARDPHQSDATQRLFKAITIAETDRIISCRGGLLVKPTATIENHPPLDLIVIPGGQGTRKEVHNQRIIAWIQQQNELTQLTTSVCTGAFLLAEGKLLDNHRATTHWGSVKRLQEAHPLIEVLANTRVVDEGHIITSAGVSAGIDMSLHIVERLHGRETALWTARNMEYEGYK